MNDVTEWMSPECLQEYNDLLEQANAKGRGKCSAGKPAKGKAGKGKGKAGKGKGKGEGKGKDSAGKPATGKANGKTSGPRRGHEVAGVGVGSALTPFL